MEGLYKKVTRGIYTRIPAEYSQDLSSVIRILLQTNPQQRPSCDKILKMPIVMKRISGQAQSEEIKCELLRTIKAENFQSISENLPKPNYSGIKKRQKNTKIFMQEQKEIKN